MTTLKANLDSYTQPGWYPDGENRLYLRVGPTGARSWVIRYRLNGKRIDKGLGSTMSVSLERARELAAAVLTTKDLTPAPVRRKAKRPTTSKRPAVATTPSVAVSSAPTLRDAARIVRDRKVEAGEIGNPKHAVNWLQVLERHVMPTLGDMPLDHVTQTDVIAMLAPIWTTLPETAKRVQARLREVFAWGQAHLYMTDNPADPKVITAALRKPRRVVKHFRALDYADVPHAFAVVDVSRGQREVRLALRFLILTAARSSEVRGMGWDEVSEDGMTWTIPAERTKTRQEHRVPLSEQARLCLREAKLAIVKRRKRNPEYASDLVFPHSSGRRLSDAALILRLRKDGVDSTVHGFRTSCRTWIAEQTDLSWEAAELCLSHQVGNSVARAYMRSDMLEVRRPVMDAWGAFVQPLPF